MFAKSNFQLIARLFVTFAIVTVTRFSTAQSSTYCGFSTGAMFHHSNSYPVAYGFGYAHASTAAEGYLRGRAAVIDSLGNYQVNEAQAEILREQARALDRENDLKQTEALQAQRKLWSDARIQARKARQARTAEGRQVIAQREATVFRHVYQLSTAELNLKTAEINWPVALRDAKFQADRTRLEDLFKQHVGYGKPRSEIANEIARSIEKWSRTLRNEVGSLPRDDYFAAQKFLLGLKYGAASVVEST